LLQPWPFIPGISARSDGFLAPRRRHVATGLLHHVTGSNWPSHASNPCSPGQKWYRFRTMTTLAGSPSVAVVHRCARYRSPTETIEGFKNLVFCAGVEYLELRSGRGAPGGRPENCRENKTSVNRGKWGRRMVSIGQMESKNIPAHGPSMYSLGSHGI
jgi:hypothetical protein